MRKSLLAAALLLGWAASPPAQAQTNNTFSFTLVPAADLFAKPGDLVGWGYQITNLDAFEWLSIDSVSTTTNFTTGIADSSNFMPLLVVPGDTQQSLFAPFTSGLYELSVDPSSLPGSVDQGTFEVSATWYTSLPGGDNCPDFSCIDDVSNVQNSDQQAFSVTVAPEPESWTFVLIGLACVGFGWRKRLSSGAWSEPSVSPGSRSRLPHPFGRRRPS